MKKDTLIVLGIACICAILGFLSFREADSLAEQNQRTANGVVFEKFETQVGYRKSHRLSNEFIMVVKEDNGHFFDLKVTPATYATHKVGDRISFKNIRLCELGEQEKGGEGFYLALAMIMAVFTAISLIVFVSVLGV